MWPKAARRLAALAIVTAAHDEMHSWLVRCSKDCNGRNQCEEVCSGKQMHHHACPYQADCPSVNTFCPDGAEPAPCVFSAWTQWSEPLGCAGLCTRKREIRQQNSCGGSACEGPLHDSKYCDGVSSCETASKDCKLGAWGEWSLCNANVTQQRERRRGVQDLPARGGAPCDGALLETQDCGPSAAESMDCQLSEWMQWSSCTTTCGSGQRGRLRTIFRHAKSGGRHCADTLGETAPCSTGPCEVGASVDCILSSWSEWSSCNAAQEKRRTRKVTQSASAAGKACTGPVTEILGCAEASTPSIATDCALSDWSEWELCDRSCGGGQTVRSRSIATEATAGGALRSAALQETDVCNTGSCSLYHQPCRPSAWSDWGACSCAPGSATRTRTYSEADAGGQACELVLKETKPCEGSAEETWQECGVEDCVMSSWSEWRSCTKTCSGGMTERDRRVVKHASVGGKPCNFEQNHLLEVKPCGEGACDVDKDCQDGVWGQWGGWSECAKSCRGGFRLAQRRVSKEANHCGTPAQGVATKIESCNDGIPCSGSVDCELTDWSSWSACDKPCTGVRERSRGIKVHPKDGGVPCGSEEKATSLSQMEHCPAEPGADCENPPPEGCSFGQWTSWSECSATCDGGQTSRSRKVLAGSDGSITPCQGETMETSPCSTQSCGHKVDCLYAEWSEWGHCTKCGGQRFRSRSILHQPLFGGMECQASETMQTGRCPRDCGEQLYWCTWSEWTGYSDCTQTCGVGIHFRKRALSMTDQRPSHPLAVASSKKDCAGEIVDIQQCDLPACDACTPQACKLSEWSEWSSPLCEGICTRNRRVATPNNECGKPCEGTLNSTKTCAAACHDKDCVLGDWSQWTACASSLDNKYRARVVLEPGAFGGKACSLSSLNETASCMTGTQAPIDCSLTEWTAWSPCSKTCGKGQQARSRSIATEASQGGKACLGSLKSLQHCELEPCASEQPSAMDCTWEQWSDWQECDGSQQVRKREVVTPADASGEPCEGVLVETKGCGEDVSLPSSCDIDVFSAWSEWSACPKSCGGAQSSRSRIIKPHVHAGLQCSGTLLETQPCGQVSCPDFPNTVCQYSQWSAWSQCSRSCGEGFKERARTITAPAVGGVEGCTGALTEADECKFGPCQSGVDCAWGGWNEWSDCVQAPSECGIGYKSRNRSIATMPSLGGKLCDPKPFEEVMPVSGCRGQAMCCVDGKWHDWEEWGACSATCGSGTRKRIRVNKAQESFCGKPAAGSDVEYEKCSAQACEVDVDCRFGDWSPFTACSAACHGQQTSSRDIVQNSTGKGSPCLGALTRSFRCNPAEGQPTPFSCQDESNHATGKQDCLMSQWSAWSGCAATCEKGYSIRDRSIEVVPQKGGQSCPPAMKEIKNCNLGISCFEGRVNCVWEAWTAWSACDAFDKKTRTRGYARHAANGGLDCEGSIRDVTGCSKGGADVCPVAWYNCSWGSWSSWSSCTTTCGRGGAQTRQRHLQVSDVSNPSSSHSGGDHDIQMVAAAAATAAEPEVPNTYMSTALRVQSRPASLEEHFDYADFKCSDNLFWKDQWPDGVKQYCCDQEQLCEDTRSTFLNSPETDSWVEELSSPLPDTVVRRYDLSLLKSKVLAAEAQHNRDVQAAFSLGCMCLVAGLLLGSVRCFGRSRSEALPRYDVVPQTI